MTIIHAYIVVIGAGVTCVEEATVCVACVEVDGDYGAFVGFVCDESVALCAEGVVDSDVIGVEVVVVEGGWDYEGFE